MSDDISGTAANTTAGTAGSECACGEAGASVANLVTPVPHPYVASGDFVFDIINFAAFLSGSIGFLTFVFSVRVLFDLRVPEVRPAQSHIQWLSILALLWAVLPPIWFWSEYWFLYVPYGDGASDAFAQFRHNQQLSAAIWAGLLAASATILSRALSRDLTLPKKDPVNPIAYAIYGSTSVSALSEDATNVLLWGGEEVSSADAMMEKFLKTTSFPALHLVTIEGMTTTIQTSSRFPE